MRKAPAGKPGRVPLLRRSFRPAASLIREKTGAQPVAGQDVAARHRYADAGPVRRRGRGQIACGKAGRKRRHAGCGARSVAGKEAVRMTRRNLPVAQGKDAQYCWPSIGQETEAAAGRARRRGMGVSLRSGGKDGSAACRRAGRCRTTPARRRWPREKTRARPCSDVCLPAQTPVRLFLNMSCL